MRRRAKRRRARGDRGAGSAEIVIAVPLLMLLILLVIQFAVWANAESIAHATAEEALAAARVQGGTAAAGQQRAHAGHQPDRQQRADRPAGLRHHDARRTSPSRSPGPPSGSLPLPGLSFPVTVTVTGPVERFVPATAQG